MSKQELRTFSRLEAQTIQSFISQVDYWQSVYREKADKVVITYYPEEDSFEVENSEPNNGQLSRGRATRFRTDLFAWANNTLSHLTGWSEREVKSFKVSYDNERFGVICEIVNKDQAQTETE